MTGLTSFISHSNRTLRISLIGLLLTLCVSQSCKQESQELQLEVIIDNENSAEYVVYNLAREDSGKIDFKRPVSVQQVIGDSLVNVVFQLDSLADLVWLQNKQVGGKAKLVYKIKNDATPKLDYKIVKDVESSGNRILSLNNQPVLQYRYEMTYPPEGVDSLYAKSGFVHPIITLKGDTLTRIQAPDHYHHYGLWGPWTHTQIDGERVDFWNLREGMGTVLFKDFKSKVSGPVFSSFTAVQEHIDLKTKDSPQLALEEDLTIRLWNLQRADRYMFDYITNFSTPLKNGILFEAYRYGGGLGLRFHERWKADNCTVLTSEGKDRSSADGSNARWCIVSGESSDGKSTNGILFLSHPENRKHPEPMRVWPLDANGGRGDMFFEFCPIRHDEWKIEPNNTYNLRYRMVVFDGTLSAAEAENYWRAFANQPEIIVTKN
ncbi:hypothetical protein D1013_14785 [Euzebyella marina]|uniref:Methane oxygenase PmoA n=1 Tax=Euzebyella marina TaxID=1761453 RepID=A0A3G2L8K3_9FLAO|nr:PmoA family protein [Euzebyella marina]AYN68556.1 hypothetical protein D1013_14785 [Euzebyella marina]